MNEPTAGFGGAPMETAAPMESAPSEAAVTETKYNYPETLAAQYHGNKSLNKFAMENGDFDSGKLMQSYIQLEQTLGKDKMVIPGQNSSPEDWKSAFKSLGLPDSLENYELKNNLPEGFQANADMLNGFKAKAHEMGVLPNQAQALLDYYNEFSTGLVTSHNEQSQATLEAGFGELRNEWGDAYDNRLGRANEALKQFASDQQIQQMKESGLLDSPIFAKVFDSVAKGMSGDNFSPESTGSFGMDAGEVDSAITQSHGKLMTIGKNHPEYQTELKKYQSLLSKKHGNTPIK